jgi:hypothetical protein
MRPIHRIAFAFAFFVLAASPVSTWHNGGDRLEHPPKFGTHDYIAFQAYKLAPAARVTWITQNLTAFFIGTEAPDTNKKIPAVTEGGYHDSLQCHCVLFDASGHVTRDRAMRRVREEFTRAVAALNSGQRDRAAFFAGAMAHYVGDLSQFCHVMGAESHWGAEDQALHAAYENAVDATVDFRSRRSSLLDGFVKREAVTGDTPEAMAEAVAAFTETGDHSTERPGWMMRQLTALGRAGNVGHIDRWPAKFRNRTGVNVNYSINAVRQLLLMITAAQT